MTGLDKDLKWKWKRSFRWSFTYQQRRPRKMHRKSPDSWLSWLNVRFWTEQCDSVERGCESEFARRFTSFLVGAFFRHKFQSTVFGQISRGFPFLEYDAFCYGMQSVRVLLSRSDALKSGMVFLLLIVGSMPQGIFFFVIALIWFAWLVTLVFFLSCSERSSNTARMFDDGGRSNFFLSSAETSLTNLTGLNVIVCVLDGKNDAAQNHYESIA